MLKLTQNEFLVRSKAIHKDKYNYKWSIYKNYRTPLKILCPKHGIFMQLPKTHIHSMCGCPKCGEEDRIIGSIGRKKNQPKRIDRIVDTTSLHRYIHKLYGIKYDLSKTIYNGKNNPVTIICREHGDLLVSLRSIADKGIYHLCMKCKYDSSRITNEDYVEKAKKLHGDKYEYHLINYTKYRDTVKVICKKHDIFTVNGSDFIRTCRIPTGCGLCRESKGEIKVSNILNNLGIEHIREYKIQPYRYEYDFYLPKYNTLIEYDGIQHFSPVQYFGGEKTFLETVARDIKKTSIAKKNGIKLIRIPYTTIDIKKLICKKLNI